VGLSGEVGVKVGVCYSWCGGERVGGKGGVRRVMQTEHASSSSSAPPTCRCSIRKRRSSWCAGVDQWSLFWL